MPGKTKIVTIREEEVDDNGTKTGWIKVARAIKPDCPVSEALFKAKGKGGYDILAESIKWISPEGQMISNKERIDHGGSIVSNSKKQTDAFEKLAAVLEKLVVAQNPQTQNMQVKK